MLFTHDTELNLAFLQALGDTVESASESGTDELSTQAQLSQLIREWKFSGRLDRDAAELTAVREARDRIRDIWGADEDAVVDWVNGILADARAVPRLVDHDGFGWHIHAVDNEAPLADRILVEAAMSLVDVIRADRLDRLRDCEADDCTGIFVDLSKNGSKRFCSTRCGNRMAVRAYRARSDS
ncbi:CGNR zinc finger domain-containing protein [Protaetiibacter mangrovi]|uniref:CGNR zinc finger domain-containing protein n=1 Tax=Protaetiibacter mangrovi TaxID=2970926 RepID=A0ABT1ZDV6_9MICO|nr:CGNR zinc finger domain-containing protein [Protaetiibacter mangrovi]MCS0498903.1 CGNR zinc finger domain-containing protein [Protaetiibacter mangrovi]TPX02680.1 CGNR zinc finger domain-containing protein [Schumannella luteola]